jgi:hypothetical protein
MGFGKAIAATMSARFDLAGRNAGNWMALAFNGYAD